MPNRLFVKCFALFLPTNAGVLFQEQKNRHTCTWRHTFIMSLVSAVLSLGICEFGVSFLAALTFSGVNLEAAITNPSHLELV